MSPSSIAQNYAQVQARLRGALAGTPDRLARVCLLAVSKTQPLEAIEELYRLGHRDFGENYVQELVQKARLASERGMSEIRWHFIGHLQTNKVKQLTPWVHAVHSVDSEKLARELASRWRQSGRSGQLEVFLQINIDGESTKSGVGVGEARNLAGKVAAFEELKLQGLMCIPENPVAAAVGGESQPSPFERLRELELRCRPYTHAGLSMGMTQDFEQALREGATHIRVGTAIFGARAVRGM